MSEALALHDGFRDRVRCDGPEVTAGGDAVLALTLALHELATNAIKYGALSTPEGVVDVSWKVVDGPPGHRLRMQWIEHGGPPVASHARKGFGSRLIATATGRSLGGEVELVFAPRRRHLAARRPARPDRRLGRRT